MWMGSRQGWVRGHKLYIYSRKFRHLYLCTLHTYADTGVYGGICVKSDIKLHTNFVLFQGEMGSN